jgi:hypothetical protein
MGWSTWNTLGCKITESNIATNIEAMVSLGLVDAGWKGLHIDDCWSVRLPNGTLTPDPAVFPSGFQKTIDAINSAGMQLGMYTARGAITCANRPGILGHETEDAAQFASWGVKYLKLDSCGDYGNMSAWDEYSLIGQALRAASSTPPYVELCEMFAYDTTNHNQGNPVVPGVAYTTSPWLLEGLPVDTIADALLVEWVNMEDDWKTLLSNFDAQFELTSRALTYAGLTNHMDMMTLCSGGMTLAEYQTQLSLWSIMTSPLILGNDFSKTDPACVDTVMKNTEVIAVDQDELVLPAELTFSVWVPQGVTVEVHTAQGTVLHSAAVPISIWWQVLQKPLIGGYLSVMVLCRDGPASAQEVLLKHVCAHPAQAEDAKWSAVCFGALSQPSGWSSSITRVVMSTRSAATGKITSMQEWVAATDTVTYPFTLSLPLLGYPSTSTASVRDLWAHSDNGTYTGAIPLPAMAPHASTHVNLHISGARRR